MPHAKLYEKLAKLSVPYNALLLIHSFINERIYKVCINGEAADPPYASNCGVPQGSNLGPLLFIIFCYDLPSAISFARIMQYADDTKLLMEIVSDFDNTKLQIDINNLVNWCYRNGLQINSNKTKVMRFGRRLDSDSIEYFVNLVKVESVKNIVDLGIHFDPKFNLNTISPAR